jgi:hypothetical protein
VVRTTSSRFRSAPACSAALTASRCPYRAATCSGVLFSCGCASGKWVSDARGVAFVLGQAPGVRSRQGPPTRAGHAPHPPRSCPWAPTTGPGRQQGHSGARQRETFQMPFLGRNVKSLSCETSPSQRRARARERRSSPQRMLTTRGVRGPQEGGRRANGPSKTKRKDFCSMHESDKPNSIAPLPTHHRHTHTPQAPGCLCASLLPEPGAAPHASPPHQPHLVLPLHFLPSRVTPENRQARNAEEVRGDGGGLRQDGQPL